MTPTAAEAAEAWELIHAIEKASDRLRDLIGRGQFRAWRIDGCLIEGATYLESVGYPQPEPQTIYTGE